MTDAVDLFDPDRIRAALDGVRQGDRYAGPEDERPRFSTEEDQWRRTLREIVDDPRGHRRRVLRGSGETWADLTALELTMPHFSKVTDLLRRANAASVRSGTRFRFAPLLLLGPPGVGKTYYARGVAKALATNCVEIAMNVANDRGRLSGFSMAWRGAGMGDIAKGALAAASSSPLFFIDEIDKTDERERCHDVLLSVMEPENATAFTDEYLTACATLRLDHALWIATANDASRIPGPLLDRMLVLDIGSPTTAETGAVARSIYKTCSRDYGSRFAPEPIPAVLDALVGISPRVTKRVLDLAIQSAMAAGRWSVSLHDVETARALVADRSSQRRVGFTQ